MSLSISLELNQYDSISLLMNCKYTTVFLIHKQLTIYFFTNTTE